MNLSEIKLDTYFLSNTISASYASASLLRNINLAYQDICRIIWESASDWDFDDSNATDLPIAKTTLVNAQQDYTLPSTAQRIKRIEVEDTNSNWLKVDPIDQSQIDVALPEFKEGYGVPKYYDLIGRSLFLYPTPTSAYCTLASGLAVYFDRSITEFSATPVTASPGFAIPFHRYLSISAALDIVEDQTKRDRLLFMRKRIEEGLVKFYSKRDLEIQPTIRPRGRKYQRQYQ
jgi:hypothetical protein